MNKTTNAPIPTTSAKEYDRISPKRKRKVAKVKTECYREHKKRQKPKTDNSTASTSFSSSSKQQQLANKPIFRSYLSLTIHTAKYTSLTKFMKQVNTENVDKICQYIILTLFNMIRIALLENRDTSLSENNTLNLLQMKMDLC